MLYIIRHGQTQQNKKQVLQGRSNFPLNDTGRAQAENAGRRLAELGISFDAVYSSPLIRAVQTAEIVAAGGTGQTAEIVAAGGAPAITTDERLIEMNYGPYEGADLLAPPPELMEFFKDLVHNPAPEGMEPLASVVARLGELLEEIKPLAAERNVLLSTHAIAMKGALEYLTPQSQGSYWPKYIGNCAVYCASVEDGKYTVPQELALQTTEE